MFQNLAHLFFPSCGQDNLIGDWNYIILVMLVVVAKHIYGPTTCSQTPTTHHQYQPFSARNPESRKKTKRFVYLTGDGLLKSFFLSFDV
jgi:hypothetical protein